jgi:paxillin
MADWASDLDDLLDQLSSKPSAPTSSASGNSLPKSPSFSGSSMTKSPSAQQQKDVDSLLKELEDLEKMTTAPVSSTQKQSPSVAPMKSKVVVVDSNPTPTPPKPLVTSSSKILCIACTDAIVDQVLEAKNAKWHPSCFRCSQCRTNLMGKKFIPGDEATEVYCTSSCAMRYLHTKGKVQ